MRAEETTAHVGRTISTCPDGTCGVCWGCRGGDDQAAGPARPDLSHLPVEVLRALALDEVLTSGRWSETERGCWILRESATDVIVAVIWSNGESTRLRPTYERARDAWAELLESERVAVTPGLRPDGVVTHWTAGVWLDRLGRADYWSAPSPGLAVVLAVVAKHRVTLEALGYDVDALLKVEG
jgi:hypothetical protein